VRGEADSQLRDGEQDRETGARDAENASGPSKVLALINGVPLVREVVDRLARAKVDKIVVVASSPHHLAIVDALHGSTGTVVSNPHPEQGLSSSLRAGVRALPEDCIAFIVALGDQPLIDPRVVGLLVEVWIRAGGGAAAVVPRYRNTDWGHPILMDASLRGRLEVLSGDAGARALLARLGDRCLRISIDADAPSDVDTPDDLRGIAVSA
jgi:molybdenum cofactor cytidylyltransferase